tara:strand:+ start:304 stop:837 length:534 start_codon:yes stop_codon:yes gene_type:complete
MTFQNRKKTFLSKLDKSKKGGIDPKVIPLINKINSQEKYFTTSSCSGRVVLWKGSGKKNEIEWLKVSHDLIDNTFLQNLSGPDLIWLKLEPFILHVCCQDLQSAKQFLSQAKKIYKKSSLLTISKKIIVEIKGSELLEIPIFKNQYLISDQELIIQIINSKFENNQKNIKAYQMLLF